MSTILRTLKKLEEEKSVLAKNLDLKGLLAQSHESAYPQKGPQASSKWGWVTGLILVGGLLGAFAVYYFYPAKQPVREVRQTSLPPAPFAMQAVKEKPVRAPSATGIPLAYIPDSHPEDADPYWEPDEFARDEVYAAPQTPLPEVKIQEEPVTPVSPEMEEINALIKTVTSAARLGDGPAASNPAVQSGYIPGLKVKGIIFFGPGNPANYIYVSTPTNKNRKLKAGEAVSNAALQSIEAQNAVFAYMGQTLAIGIGE